jgi:hypothetical protein
MKNGKVFTMFVLLLFSNLNGVENQNQYFEVLQTDVTKVIVLKLLIYLQNLIS